MANHSRASLSLFPLPKCINSPSIAAIPPPPPYGLPPRNWTPGKQELVMQIIKEHTWVILESLNTVRGCTAQPCGFFPCPKHHCCSEGLLSNKSRVSRRDPMIATIHWWPEPSPSKPSPILAAERLRGLLNWSECWTEKPFLPNSLPASPLHGDQPSTPGPTWGTGEHRLTPLTGKEDAANKEHTWVTLVDP